MLLSSDSTKASLMAPQPHVRHYVQYVLSYDGLQAQPSVIILLISRDFPQCLPGIIADALANFLKEQQYRSYSSACSVIALAANSPLLGASQPSYGLLLTFLRSTGL